MNKYHDNYIYQQKVYNEDFIKQLDDAFGKKSFEIKKVIFNNPATIILWKDGTKTIVKCGEHDIYDPEKGMAMAITKRALGNKGNYYNKIKEWLPVDYSPVQLDGALKKAINSVYGLTSAIMSVDLAKSEDFTCHQETTAYIQENKYGDKYDTRLFFAGKNHKIVCAGDCYHVRNIKKENALVYTSLKAALMDGCIPCKHCHGRHKEEE